MRVPGGVFVRGRSMVGEDHRGDGMALAPEAGDASGDCGRGMVCVSRYV